MNNDKVCVGEARQSLPQKVDETNSVLAKCIDIAGSILLTLKQKEKIGSSGMSPGCFLEAVEITQVNAKLLHDELVEIAFAFAANETTNRGGLRPSPGKIRRRAAHGVGRRSLYL